DYKNSLPMMSNFLFQVALGMVLGDATMYRVSREAIIKFEQGAIQKDFLFHVFKLFSEYCFMLVPGTRLHLRGVNIGQIKSYWFKTFSHPTFSVLWELLFVDGKKVILEGLILNHLTDVGLAYWIMCDGSLDGRIMILHTQGFTLEENNIISNELNIKFGFNTKVVPHKHKYFVIQFSGKDANKLHEILKDNLIPSMMYKLPKK
ncbi:LAGLIDADG endonuclease, partial [Pseudoxanthomonas sangjuensis]